MKPLYKTTVLATLGLLLVSLSVILSVSCRKDRCRETHCANGGVCFNDVCRCAMGYEGVNCVTASRDKFLGNWTQTVDSSSVTSAEQYEVSVAPGARITDVVIGNFNNTPTGSVSGYVSHNDSLIIQAQVLQGKVIAGYCFYVNSNNIIVHYTVTDSVTGLVNTINTNW